MFALVTSKAVVCFCLFLVHSFSCVVLSSIRLGHKIVNLLCIVWTSQICVCGMWVDSVQGTSHEAASLAC